MNFFRFFVVFEFFYLFIILPSIFAVTKVEVGIDVFFKDGYVDKWKGKKIGLITNHTAVNSKLLSTLDVFLSSEDLQLTAIFAPEHGLYGQAYAAEKVENLSKIKNIPVYSLHGDYRRPTAEMLKNVDVLFYDIQDTGTRSYTYATTLYYAMEEAVKYHIPVVVLDRPNPLGGHFVDGPMLNENLRSFVGYINIPYCHGMTIGELARFFNEEYEVKCDLQVISMKGWKRSMTFKETNLPWIPTSPHIPEPDTPLFYATTGLIGELSIVNIGVGYTLPFKVVGAPWICSKEFSEKLNQQKLSGVHFVPFHFRPQYGLYKGQNCEGVLLRITNTSSFRPFAVQALLLGVLKTLYPQKFKQQLIDLPPQKKKLFNLTCGNQEFLTILTAEKYVIWKLIGYQKDQRESFAHERAKYLLYK